MKLYKHQEEGVKHMIDHAFGCANFSEMGTGKTVMAIVAANEIVAERIMVTCPNSLKRNWEKEFKMFSSMEYECVVLDGTKRKKIKAIKSAKSKRVVIIVNYESLVSLEDELVEFRPELIIADESHNIKSHTAKKTKCLKKIRDRAQTSYKWILTGTPTPNNPLDIWSQYDFIRPGYLHKNFYAFRNTYADVYTGAGFPMIRGFRNQEELREKIGLYSYRALKNECLDLPDKVFQEITVELTPKNKKLYKDMADHMVADIGDEKVAANIVLVKLLRLQQITSGFIRTELDEDRVIGREKLDALKDLVESLSGEKIVIWAKFNFEIQRIREELEKIGRTVHLMVGATPTEERAKMVKDFQESEDNSQVIVANVAVGGAGLTLTESRYSIYYSRTFSLGDARQSEDRIHRIGQNRKVTYYDLVCDKTIDQYILKLINKKQKLSDTITGDALRQIIEGGL